MVPHHGQLVCALAARRHDVPRGAQSAAGLCLFAAGAVHAAVRNSVRTPADRGRAGGLPLRHQLDGAAGRGRVTGEGGSADGGCSAAAGRLGVSSFQPHGERDFGRVQQ